MKTILRTHDLSIGYRNRHTVTTIASDLSLSIGEGELIGLLGPNGAGKSTLMRTLAGMQAPLGGRITLLGDDINNLAAEQMAKRMSIVLTERPNLGLLNGYALVALGRHPHTDWTGRLSHYDQAMVNWAIDAVDAGDLAERPVMELSDGQRQKLMIARALAQESALILLDEPTAYLDLPRRVEIMQLLRHLAAETGRAILLSTHDLDLALRTADSLWLMAEGRVRVGTPEDLVLNGAFESAFHSAGVPFDRQTGAFSIERTTRPTIAVQGAGIAYLWTCRALKRAGYGIATDDDSSSVFCVCIIGDDEHPRWHLHHDDIHTQHESIHTLLTALDVLT
ncbi:MAG: ABC transporter ATP-binding protein [Anaerolineae bacterium]